MFYISKLIQPGILTEKSALYILYMIKNLCSMWHSNSAVSSSLDNILFHF